MAIYIFPYKAESESAMLLAKELGVKRLKRENSAYKYKKGDIIINWGCTGRLPHIPEDAIIINPFLNVACATNKAIAFDKLVNTVRIPDYTDDPVVVYEWLKNGKTVVGREKVNGYGGEGIVLIEPEDIDDIEDIPVCPLYTMYVPKKSEYRVHVAYGRVVSVARKTLKKDHPNKNEVDWRIRNLDGGFIFAYWNEKHKEEERHCCPVDVSREATKAVTALGLDFGAVDVIYNEKYGRAYVLEVNTAPGLGEGIAVMYARVFMEKLAAHRLPPIKVVNVNFENGKIKVEDNF